MHPHARHSTTKGFTASRIVFSPESTAELELVATSWTPELAQSLEDLQIENKGRLHGQRGVVAAVYDFDEEVAEVEDKALLTAPPCRPSPPPCIDYVLWNPHMSEHEEPKLRGNWSKQDLSLLDRPRYAAIRGPIYKDSLPPLGSHIEDCHIPYIASAIRRSDAKAAFPTTFKSRLEQVLKLRRPYGRPYLQNGRICRWNRCILMGSAEYLYRYPESANGDGSTPWIDEEAEINTSENADRLFRTNMRLEAIPSIPIMIDSATFTLDELTEVYSLAVQTGKASLVDFINTVAATYTDWQHRGGQCPKRASRKLIRNGPKQEWTMDTLEWSEMLLDERLVQKERLGLKVDLKPLMNLQDLHACLSLVTAAKTVTRRQSAMRQTGATIVQLSGNDMRNRHSPRSHDSNHPIDTDEGVPVSREKRRASPHRRASLTAPGSATHTSITKDKEPSATPKAATPASLSAKESKRLSHAAQQVRQVINAMEDELLDAAGQSALQAQVRVLKGVAWDLDETVKGLAGSSDGPGRPLPLSAGSEWPVSLPDGQLSHAAKKRRYVILD